MIPSKGKIIVADDDVDITGLLQKVLNGEGYDVVAVNDGDAAVAAHEREKPDLMILDWAMPGKDGLQVNTRDIFRFQQVSVDEQGRSIGFYTGQDYTPSFQDEFRLKGIKFPKEIYESEETKKNRGPGGPGAAPGAPKR